MKFSAVIVVGWISATLVAAFTFTVFAYNEFETKEHAKETHASVVKQLDSIETKIDKVIDKLNGIKK